MEISLKPESESEFRTRPEKYSSFMVGVWPINTLNWLPIHKSHANRFVTHSM